MAVMSVYGIPAHEENVSAVTQTPSISIGERVNFKGEEYVYCYNAGAAAITVGLGVNFVTGASGYSICATAHANVYTPLVGVVKNTAFASGDYGWVCVRGFTTVSFVTTITKDYCPIALGLGGKFIESSGPTTLGTSVIVGVALNPAGTTGYAFIRGSC